MMSTHLLRPGDAVLDIGAADGYYAKAYGEHVGPTGHVLAVEPHPVAIEQLRERCAHQPWVCGMQVAVGAEAGRVVLYSDGDEHKRSSLYPENLLTSGESYSVTMTTLDVLVANMLKRPRLIKIDAQGAEAAILRGATETLTQPIWWVLELWNEGLRHAGSSVAEVLNYFRAGFVPAHPDGGIVSWSQAQADAERQTSHSSVDLLFIPRAGRPETWCWRTITPSTGGRQGMIA